MHSPVQYYGQTKIRTLKVQLGEKYTHKLVGDKWVSLYGRCEFMGDLPDWESKRVSTTGTRILRSLCLVDQSLGQSNDLLQ